MKKETKLWLSYAKEDLKKDEFIHASPLTTLGEIKETGIEV